MANFTADFESLPCWTRVNESSKGDIVRDKEFLRKIHHEVWITDNYETQSLRGQWDVLIDLGCNLGFVSQRLLSTGKVNCVEAVECYQPYIDASKENLAVFGNRVTFHYGFAAGKNFMSLYGPTLTSAPLISIDDLVRKHIGKKILLKIDIEGWEYPVLQSLTQNGLHVYIDRVMGEFHDATKDRNGQYFCDPSRKATRKILTDFGTGKALRVPVETKEGAILGTFFLE